MKKMPVTALLFFFLLCNKVWAQNLKDVTIGFAAGPSYKFTNTCDYSLSPDASSSLKLQKVPNLSFVVSSTLTVKFKKLKVDTETAKLFTLANDTPAKPKDKFALVVGINLLEIKNDVKFNQSIDGGVGLGYFIHENTQIALMFDISTIRQMREYLVNLYENKPIPKGTDFYNALDLGDNNLFYNKTIFGTSFKVIFSL